MYAERGRKKPDSKLGDINLAPPQAKAPLQLNVPAFAINNTPRTRAQTDGTARHVARREACPALGRRPPPHTPHTSINTRR